MAKACPHGDSMILDSEVMVTSSDSCQTSL